MIDEDKDMGGQLMGGGEELMEGDVRKIFWMKNWLLGHQAVYI